MYFGVTHRSLNKVQKRSRIRAGVLCVTCRGQSKTWPGAWGSGLGGPGKLWGSRGCTGPWQSAVQQSTSAVPANIGNTAICNACSRVSSVWPQSGLYQCQVTYRSPVGVFSLPCGVHQLQTLQQNMFRQWSQIFSQIVVYGLHYLGIKNLYF